MEAVALVFQNPDQGLFSTTVAEECAFLPRNLGLDAAAARSRSLAVLDRLHMGPLAERAPFTLSYGEKRRVSLASVLTGGARILCLDEPTVGLDRANLEILAELVRDYADTCGGVILATHDRAFAQAVATRTVDLGPGGAA
jgi:energy-coupling factor transport system ATP-binding protein